MPPFPHHFQVPVTLVPTVQPFCPVVLSLEQQWLTCNVEILHRAQIGQDVYTEYARTIYIYIYIYIYVYIYIDNFPFSPQLKKIINIFVQQKS